MEGEKVEEGRMEMRNRKWKRREEEKRRTKRKKSYEVMKISWRVEKEKEDEEVEKRQNSR